MSTDEHHTLSLTGPASHTLVRSPGQGDIVIGPRVPTGPQPHLVVNPDDRIDWSVFDAFTTGSGYPWPRWITYRGNDTGFVDWSANREIERFEWTPTAPAALDASRARIGTFGVRLRAVAVDVVLPGTDCDTFTASGDLSLLSLTRAPGADGPQYVEFSPETLPTPSSEPVALPRFPALADVIAVAVFSEPLRQAVDCTGVEQFSQVEHLRLRGQLTGLAALTRLPALTSLNLFFSPDLSSLPAVAEFPALVSVMASNIDETVGARLLAETTALTQAGDGTLEYASITELRQPEWFTTEYGLPFATWAASTARDAVTAYRAAERAIADATAADQVETAIRGFVRVVNTLPGIDTVEREDTAVAVDRLARAASVQVDAVLAQSWFDAERDF